MAIRISDSTILDPHHFIAGVVRVAYVVTHVPTHWVPLVVISKIWNPFLTPVLAEPPPPPTRICRAEICQEEKINTTVMAVLWIRIDRIRIQEKIISDLDPGRFEYEMSLK